MPHWRSLATGAVLAMTACSSGQDQPALNLSGLDQPGLGRVVDYATTEQREAFARGRQLARKRFVANEGHGPQFNTDSCAACHERPVTGGSAARYRNFNLVGRLNPDSAVFEPTGTSGVQTQFSRAAPARVPSDTNTRIIATRNPIPFFGVGRLAEIRNADIRALEDPEDRDGDGISGRANFDDLGRLGRFGRKAQAATVEGFVRGPLFNHMGITSRPLSPERRAALRRMAPIAVSPASVLNWLGLTSAYAQAAAADSPNADDDGIADPELSDDQLFDLLAFTLFLAPPEAEALNERTQAGLDLFRAMNCIGCHRPELPTPFGPVAAFTDLLLHDMGPELADGIEMGRVATGSEFRTQPLWGVAATGPYLHDGRADTLAEAIEWHAGEATAAREAWSALDSAQQNLVVEFLESLGGRLQASPGRLPPDAPPPRAQTPGGPDRALSPEDQARFDRGRLFFDQDFPLAGGLGLLFNGDSCRACHFDPAAGGSGPVDVNVVRHGARDADGAFLSPSAGTILHRFTTVTDQRAQDASAQNSTIFELRQTPPLFGLGLIAGIPVAAILAHTDPEDQNGDGISGKAHVLPDGRLGRFGWKAQVPSLHEFARDALSAELGITLPDEPGQTFGTAADQDMTTDPEIDPAALADLTFFMQRLAPLRSTARQAPLASRGLDLFERTGCATCHVPTLPGADGDPVALYSDLLLHDVQADDFIGVTDGQATEREFRTPPLWGLAASAPYWHHGLVDTIEQAIESHAAEAGPARQAFAELNSQEREQLLEFLNSI